LISPRPDEFYEIVKFDELSKHNQWIVNRNKQIEEKLKPKWQQEEEKKRETIGNSIAMKFLLNSSQEIGQFLNSIPNSEPKPSRVLTDEEQILLKKVQGFKK